MDRTVAWLTPSLAVLPSRAMAYNAGLFAHGGSCLLVDPGPHRDEVAAAAAFAGSCGLGIAGLLLTHSHWDHILGPELLPGVPVAAHEGFAATLAAAAERTLILIGRWEDRAGHRRQEPFALPRADRLVADGDRVELGGLTLLAIHIPGHAADQLALFEPESGALWAADTLSDLELPFVSHSLAAYEQTLEALAALPIRALVPGHGAPTADEGEIRARLDADRAYLAGLRDALGPVVRAGGCLGEALAACAAMAYRAPEANAPYHRLNVESAYIELGGDADPAAVGWAQKGLLDE